MKQFLGLVLMTLALGAQAGDGEWTGKTGLGYLATSGNSETTNANIYADGEYNINKWSHGLNGLIIGAETQSQSTAERYEAAYKGKYSLSDVDYMFGLVSYEKDKFAGYDNQISETIGYGRRLYNTDLRKWNVEVGLGAKQAELRDTTSQDETILRGATDYLWKFSDTGRFSQVLAVEAGDENTYIESVTSVGAQLLGQFALVAAYTIKNNSDVPAGTEKTDTFSSISVEYGF